MKSLKEMVFSLSHKFENNTTQIPEFWPNSGIGGQAFPLNEMEMHGLIF